ncbi:L-carnitine dehydratase/bile acid-inducible protein F [Parafrankia sp. EAN1pec]|uniref:CaiB/BaiF CoA transferase family protein n=1 Tax=Parafrankia sp. (strain EAN1pec) TaxID=298653 RepID=UPI00015D9E35|nr:L-carnitine dehydratase/bile acid-inducible protein F [Frankia sp. EAN1pec]
MGEEAKSANARTGPLAGLRVLEMAGLGPVPFAAMMLADLGADVIRVERPGGDPFVGSRKDIVTRGRRNVIIDGRDPAGRDLVLALIASRDVLLEGYRPGVMEKLGLGPEECEAVNPRLVYGRMTGWGQNGPLAHTAGHDITYIARTGALWATGRAGEAPSPPLNLVGDYGGGAMLLLVGVLGALFESSTSGRGQVVDAAMVDGTALLTTLIWSMRAAGTWRDARGSNLLDGGAPFYDVYTCKDGGHIAIGAIEPQFYAELVRRTGYDAEGRGQWDVHSWPQQKAAWADLFARRTRAEWTALLEDGDACAAPVLSWHEAPEDEHLWARGTFVHVDGMIQPAPAPRFGRSGTSPVTAPPAPGEHTDQVLVELGFSPEHVDDLRRSGVVA